MPTREKLTTEQVNLRRSVFLNLIEPGETVTRAELETRAKPLQLNVRQVGQHLRHAIARGELAPSVDSPRNAFTRKA